MMKKGVISLLVFVLFFISATNTTIANGNSDQERFSNETIDTTLTEIIDIISE
ncbi:hypothetical protein [Salisediminibacterium beveridgei]|uniref:hypothetical protein n=1 Tax=Salisediminibacterium beveridgei TaxID=632773 RepID=UPI0012ED498E|nr:hypothetical protein [Salisediminibacterium beveridgei]